MGERYPPEAVPVMRVSANSSPVWRQSLALAQPLRETAGQHNISTAAQAVILLPVQAERPAERMEGAAVVDKAASIPATLPVQIRLTGARGVLREATATLRMLHRQPMQDAAGAVAPEAVVVV